MVDERDAEDAIRGLDRIEFGRKGRRLRVEWTKQERSRKAESSKAPSSFRPSKTLFVINFDPYHTRTRDLERHFDPYGKILNVRIRRNFAFIQYESQEDATKALDATNLSKLMDRVITVEYAVKDDDDRRSGYSPDRSHGRSPKRSYDGGRYPSPYGGERESPDYGSGRGRSRSPYRRERASPNYGQGRSAACSGRERNSEYGSGRHPSPRKERNSDHSRGHSPSPRKERLSSEKGHNTSPREQRTPNNEHETSPNPRREKRERMSADDYGDGRSPGSNPELTDSPGYGRAESPFPQRQRSRSPPARERSQS